MCTCIKFDAKDHYFGRTLDLEMHYNEEAIIVPRNYHFVSPGALDFKNKYALIGTAMVMNNYPLFYEAVNEYGLSMAGLNFPKNAVYFPPKENKLNLTPSEIISYLLGNYKSVKEVKEILPNLIISNVTFMPSMPLTPLHYMLSDKDESIVIEQTKDGLKVFPNPYNIMTNNPSFDLQIKGLENISSLTNGFKDASDPRYHCVGLGAVGLPGDFSSMSRFQKGAFLLKHATRFESEEENVAQFFHILDNISMIDGVIKTKDNKNDITYYMSCINMDKGIYYYKTYFNNQISSLRFTDANKNSESLTRHPLNNKENINYLN